MQAVTTIGFDIANRSFRCTVLIVSAKCLFAGQLKRRQVIAFFQKLPACLVGIEASASSHHWARQFLQRALELEHKA